MKTLAKKLSGLALGAFIVTLMLGSSTTAIAQSKPKGKPWAVPEAAAKTKNPVKSDDGTIKEGKELYAQHCKSCHGAKGKGDGTKAEKLDISCGDFSDASTSKMTDGDLYYKTTEGRKPMPSFKEKLSDNERWAIVHYLRTLASAK